MHRLKEDYREIQQVMVYYEMNHTRRNDIHMTTQQERTVKLVGYVGRN